ncbi:MAG TPA: hypothetical protein VFO17_09090 [Acidimicrobiia bacterium]|jgi:hypothetical protein|nr:hypothetical protein [Acidimicrobiia bacterium]
MAVNPDPKPGRWILPLVVLGMIAFTYFFVRELPEASTQTTLVASPGTTGPEGTGDPGDTPGTTVSGTTPDPATQAYLTEIDAINQELQAQRTDLSAVNTAFNADPREIEFPDAEDRFEAIQAATQALAERHAALTPPAALQANHDTLLAAVNLASQSITQALEGLRSTDTGEQRNSAVEAFVTAAADYDTEVTNTHNVAGA